MIAISGATGYIGGKLANALEKLEIPFLIISRDSNASSLQLKKGWKVLDAKMSIVDLAHEFKQYKVSGIMHLASKFLVEHGPDDIEDLMRSNILYGARLAEAAAISDVNWFLNVGTIWQHYSGADYDPVNLYSATKQAFQDIGAYYASSKKFKFTTIKLPDTYGPDDSRRKIFGLWRNAALSGGVLGMSPGEQFLDVVHVDDVINALVTLLRKMQSSSKSDNYLEEYYITSGDPKTLKQLAGEFEEAMGVKLPIIWGARPYRLRELMFPVSSGTPIVVRRENVFKD